MLTIMFCQKSGWSVMDG